MKKYIFLMSLLFSSAAFAEDFITLINRDNDATMTIEYEICTLNEGSSPYEPFCYPTQGTTLEKGQSIKISVDNWVFDMVVTNAVAKDAQGKTIATSHFMTEYDCKGFALSTLSFSRADQDIQCLRTNKKH